MKPPTGLKISKVRGVREARRLDCLDIAVWGSENPSRHRFFEYFLYSGMRVYRAVLRGKAVGALVTGYPTSAELMEVEEIMVLPGYRKRGIGKALLEFARKEARRRGHKGIVVEVDQKNRHARSWYRKNGLGTVGWVMVDNVRAWAEEERVIKPGRNQ